MYIKKGKSYIYQTHDGRELNMGEKVALLVDDEGLLKHGVVGYVQATFEVIKHAFESHNMLKQASELKLVVDEFEVSDLNLMLTQHGYAPHFLKNRGL